MSEEQISDFMDIDIIKSLAEGLCKSLREEGIKATILETGISRSSNPEVIGGKTSKLDAYSVYSPYDAPQYLGCIKIEGANFEQLQIWQKQIFGHPSIFRAVRWRDIHFVIPRPKEARKLKREKIDEALQVNLKYETKGFIKKKLVDVKWQQGRLADMLNSSELSSWLLEEKKREFSKKGKVDESNDLRIMDEKGYGCVRIYLPMDEDESGSNSRVISKTLAYLKICDEIAGNIRALFAMKDL